VVVPVDGNAMQKDAEKKVKYKSIFGGVVCC